MSFPPELIDAAVAGDDHAIRTLLARAQPDIRRYARRTCRTTSDVEDAAQEVMIILHRRMPTLRGIGSLSGWLFVLVNRACLRLMTAVLPFVEFRIAAPREVRDASNADLAIDLSRGIESLPRPYREVLLMRDVDGQSIAEIAQTTGATRAAVKARLHRARRLMREYLSD